MVLVTEIVDNLFSMETFHQAGALCDVSFANNEFSINVHLPHVNRQWVMTKPTLERALEGMTTRMSSGLYTNLKPNTFKNFFSGRR